MAFRRVARADEIPPGETRYYEVDGVPVVLAHWNGRFFALAGICPHQNLPLDGARLWDRLLTCPWHNYQYDITTGENYFPKRVYPADLEDRARPLAAYAVERRGDELWVDLA